MEFITFSPTHFIAYVVLLLSALALASSFGLLIGHLTLLKSIKWKPTGLTSFASFRAYLSALREKIFYTKKGLKKLHGKR